MNAMVSGDFTTAYNSLCPDWQSTIAQAASENGVSPEDATQILFYQVTLSGHGISGGNVDGVENGGDLDIVSFTLQLDDGSTYDLVVGVDQNLAVCGWQ